MIIVAAMRFPALIDDGSVRALAFSGAKSGGRPGCPPDTLLADGFLAGLLHFCRAAGTPTLALLVPGYKARGAGDNDALDAASTLAAAACGALDCAFSPQNLRRGAAPPASAFHECTMYV